MDFSKDKKIVIYGLGEEYEKQKVYLHKRFDVVGYCDIKQLNIEHYINRNELVNCKFDYIFITSRKYYSEIKNELINLGIDQTKIISEITLICCMLNDQEEINRDYYHFKYGNKTANITIHNEDIYEPLYSKYASRMPEVGPEIYNMDGERMETFFIRDEGFAHDPYWSSRYFLWDRYNWKLNTHFYVNEAMSEVIGSPKRKFGLVMEARILIPQFYDRLIQNKSLCSEYDKVFTYDEELLDKIPNAAFWNPAAFSWYGKSEEGLNNITDAYRFKTKNISILASNKDMSMFHKIRRELAMKCKKKNLADTYGQFDGGSYLPNVDLTLKEYRYQIVVENETTPFGFSEKIISCFDAQTVPIYLGASEIGKFFNEDGILKISIEDIDHIENILSSCNEKDYEQRLPAIIDNYNRVKENYRNSWDLLYKHYIKE